MSRASDTPNLGRAVMPTYVDEWARSGISRVYTTTRPLSFLSCVAVYFTGQPESVSCLHSRIERIVAHLDGLFVPVRIFLWVV